MQNYVNAAIKMLQEAKEPQDAIGALVESLHAVAGAYGPRPHDVQRMVEIGLAELDAMIYDLDWSERFGDQPGFSVPVLQALGASLPLEKQIALISALLEPFFTEEPESAEWREALTVEGKIAAAHFGLHLGHKTAGFSALGTLSHKLGRGA